MKAHYALYKKDITFNGFCSPIHIQLHAIIFSIIDGSKHNGIGNTIFEADSTRVFLFVTIAVMEVLLIPTEGTTSALEVHFNLVLLPCSGRRLE